MKYELVKLMWTDYECCELMTLNEWLDWNRERHIIGEREIPITIGKYNSREFNLERDTQRWNCVDGNERVAYRLVK
jgi:hypothetical protein